jgi:hypothetical protein
MLGITGFMWSVSAEREFRHKMPEVRIDERIGTVPGWIAVTRILLTCSATARQIRTFQVLVEADHRAREGTEGGRRPRGLRIERREEARTRCGNTAFMGYSVQRGCGKDICIYAKKRIDKFHQCCTIGDPYLVRLVCKREVGLL